MRTERPELTISLEPQPAWIDIQWLDKGRRLCERYSIPAAAAEAAGRDVRVALSALEAVPSSSDHDDERVRALRAVAAAGQQLYRVLFSGSDPASHKVATKQREWFEAEVLAEPENWRIQFVQTRPGRIMPWGLTFTERPGRDLEALGGGIEDYQDFWCISFACATRGSVPPPKRMSLSSNVRVGAILEADHSMIENYNNSKKNSDRFQQEMDSLRQNLIGDRQKAEDVIDQSRETSCYYYVSLKAISDNNENRFDDGGPYTYYGEKISPREILPEGGEHIRLVLFDGDAVIRHDRGEAWVEFCMQSPQSGCIAVESDVVHPRNRMFGWNIFEYVIKSGKPLLDSVAEAREKYWPLSLLYGVYCNPLGVSIDCSMEDIDPISDFIRFQKSQMVEGGDVG